MCVCACVCACILHTPVHWWSCYELMTEGEHKPIEEKDNEKKRRKIVLDERGGDCWEWHTNLTSLFCKLLSVISRQRCMQLLMYKWRNSVGRSTAWETGDKKRKRNKIDKIRGKENHVITWVSRFTTSIECKDISILTRAAKYLHRDMSMRIGVHEWQWVTG